MIELIVYYLVMGVITMLIMLCYDKELQKYFSPIIFIFGVVLWLPLVVNKLCKFIRGD